MSDIVHENPPQDTSQQADKVSDDLTDVIEAIIAVEDTKNTSPIVTDLDSNKAFQTILTDLKHGSLAGYTDIEIGGEVWKVPNISNHGAKMDILESAIAAENQDWLNLTSHEVEGFFKSLDEVVEKNCSQEKEPSFLANMVTSEGGKTQFIAVPLKSDGISSAFTIELSAADATPLLAANQHKPTTEKTVSSMLLNEVAAASYRELCGIEKCCELDSPACMTSSLLLADVAAQIEREMTSSNTNSTQPAPKSTGVEPAPVSAPTPTSSVNSVTPAPPGTVIRQPQLLPKLPSHLRVTSKVSV